MWRQDNRVAAIRFPAMLFSAEDIRSPFVQPLLDERVFRTQQYRWYRSGGFREFLVVDSDGRRIKGRALGIARLDYGLAFEFGVVTGLLEAVLNTLLLDPPVALRYELNQDGVEPLQDTKERIYKYIGLNPRHYQRTDVRSLRQRVAKARNMDVLVHKLIED